LLTGILLGLGAASAQALSYNFSRHYILRCGRTVGHLLILGHVLMGILSLMLLPLLPLSKAPPWQMYAWPLATSAGFYLLGQLAMFQMLRHAEASRASPLLGLKILILAVIYSVFLQTRLAPLQWLAVGLGLAAAFLLRTSGKHLSAQTIGWLLLACLGYSLSDMGIYRLMRALEATLGVLQANFIAVCLTYLLCGVLVLPALIWSPAGRRSDWYHALPWAVSWFGAMLLLFLCFNAIGVVFGNIVQASRGLMSIVMGAGLAHLGYHHLEEKVPRRVLLRRLVAAVVMFAAIALYARAQQVKN
jgi:drug/metabolite transporter (DMT)-like permease